MKINILCVVTLLLVYLKRFLTSVRLGAFFYLVSGWKISIPRNLDYFNEPLAEGTQHQ